MTVQPSTREISGGVPWERLAEGENIRRHFRQIGELAAEIQAHTLLEPLVVRKEGDAWIIVCGARRYRAIKLLRERAALERRPPPFDAVPSREFVGSALDAILANISENEARHGNSTWDLACQVASIQDRFGLGLPELAERMRRSKSYLSNLLAVHGRTAGPIRDTLDRGFEIPSEYLFEWCRMPAESQVIEWQKWLAAGKKKPIVVDKLAQKRPGHREIEAAKTVLLAQGNTLALELLEWIQGLRPSPLPPPLPKLKPKRSSYVE